MNQLPKRTPAELAADLRSRAGFLHGASWEVPATRDMMNEAAQMIEELSQSLVTLRALSAQWRWEAQARDYGSEALHLVDHRGRNRCTVWKSGGWHTWDERGTGGENDTAPNVTIAKEQALAAIVRQGWAVLVSPEQLDTLGGGLWQAYRKTLAEAIATRIISSSSGVQLVENIAQSLLAFPNVTPMVQMLASRTPLPSPPGPWQGKEPKA